MNKILPWIAVAIAVLFMTKQDKPIQSKVRGIRNNNPGNIRKTNIKWAGEVVPGTDSAFEQFKSMPYGIRAMLVDIIGKHKRGLDTIQELINVWAPPFENCTITGEFTLAAASSVALMVSVPVVLTAGSANLLSFASL